MKDVGRIEWHLEDLRGDLHTAIFVRCTERSDVEGMQWDPNHSWVYELNYANTYGFEVYKIIDGNGVTHGGISMKDDDGELFIEFIEAATHNRHIIPPNPNRTYVNVARLLIAFAGQRSIEIGAGGLIVLEPKGNDGYYKNKYSAFELLGSPKLAIPGSVTKHWIRVYYK